MNLPNEIDQPVMCVQCGWAMHITPDGWAVCSLLEHPSIHPKHVAALRNQRTPGTTEIPDVELERLREAVDRLYRDVDGENGSIVRAARAVFAHIPAKVKTDHVAELRELLAEKRRNAESSPANLAKRFDGVIAALEAAIEAMEKP